jgi:uncharacterized protein YndB with AHSA1/START domain
MAGKSPKPDTALQITRIFTAAREKVFKAWTDPRELKRWFAPSDDYSVPIAEVDLRVGGKYRLQMKAPNGDAHTVSGTFREVTVPERLVYTWAWEETASCMGSGSDAQKATLVTVEFHDRGKTTEVVLTHELFPDTTARDKHSEGWTACLNQLAKML